MPIAIEECAICGGKYFAQVEKYKPHRGGQDLVTYVACDQCGLVFMNPMPTQDELSKYYAGSYWESHVAGEAAVKKQRTVADSIIGYLDFHFPGWLQSRKSILEIGSSFGVTLNSLGKTVSERGGDATLSAIEPSALATQVGAENYLAVQLLGTDIDDLQAVSATFDLIILSHVLEHLQYPVAALRLLASKLAIDGMIFIEVPNYYGHLSVDYAHNYLFTECSLRNTLMCAGLNVRAFDTRYRSRRISMYLTTLVDCVEGKPAVQKVVLERESSWQVRIRRKTGRAFSRAYTAWVAARNAARI